jgi:outer membrane protein
MKRLSRRKLSKVRRARSVMKGRALCFMLLLGWSPAVNANEPAEADCASTALLVSKPGGLTAEDVAQRAEATGLSVKARGRALAAAEASLAQAWAAFIPRLTLTARYTRLSSYKQPALQTLPTGALDAIATDPRVAANPSTLALAQDVIQAYEGAASVGSRFPIILNQFLAQAALVVPVSDYVLRLSWQYSAASHSVKAASLLERAARATTSADARVLYYTWLRAMAQVLVAQRSLVQAQQHLEDAERHLQAGLIASADVSRVQTQVASAELVVQRARNTAELRQEQIRTVMHDTGPGRYAPGEELMVDAASFDVREAVRRLQEEATSRRLELQSLDETVRSFARQARAARALGWPQLSVFGTLTSARPNPRIVPATDEFRTTWEVGGQVVWVPSDAPGANALAAESQAKSEELALQSAELRDNIALEVFQAYQETKDAVLAVATTARATASAEEAYLARRDLFRSGGATSADLTDAEFDWVRAQMDAIDSQTELRIARVRLDHAIGRDYRHGNPASGSSTARAPLRTQQISPAH